MVVLEATVDESQVERELESIDDPEVDVNGELQPSNDLGGDDGGGGGGQLATISRRLLAILGAVGALLQLDTVVELLEGIFRVVELALLPFIALFNAVLAPILQDLARSVAEFDFDQFTDNIGDMITDGIDNLISGLPFVGDDTSPGGGGGTGTSPAGGPVPSNTRPGPGGSQIVEGSVADDVFNLIGNEFSNAGISEFLSNQGNDTSSEDSPGGLGGQ